MHSSKMIAFLLLPLFANAQAIPASPSNASTIERRANDLLKQMTPEEKIGQLTLLFNIEAPAVMNRRIDAGTVGGLLFASDAKTINALQHEAVERSRLHIPLLFGFDVIHGYRTIFPVPIAMAASWDPQMVENAQAIAAEEARATGISWAYGPMVDIARDPRWGRMVEGAGEDPFLGSVMARAQVLGFQGPSVGTPDRVVASVKHFAGYGAALGGRDYDQAQISDDELWNVYLPPFRSAVDAGAGTVMSAYMDLNGVPATGNRWLLHDVLRDQWKFKGFVVSDSDAVKDLATHGFAAGVNDAAYRALHSGVNMEMALGDPAFPKGLPVALEDGRITPRELDDAVRPILETKLRLGLFEHPYADEAAAESMKSNEDHMAAAGHAAELSAVLLRNEGHLLPLAVGANKRIAVIGPLGDSQADTNGSWAFAADPSHTVTVAAGLKQLTGAATEVGFAQGVQIARKFPSIFDAATRRSPQVVWTDEQARHEFDKAVQLAASADVVIMVLGEAQNMSGEMASRSSLELPGRQQQLLEAIVTTGKPVVLVLMSGRPLNIQWANTHVPAILEAWYPGTRGGDAVANLLFGKAIPGGKLPFTWPRDVGQVPMFYAHTPGHQPATQERRYWDEESTPLYPFGFGLSYAKFKFANLRIAQASIGLGQSVEASVEVTNEGSVTTDEVVQLYIHQQSGTSSRPVRELKAFRRVTLAPGKSQSVAFTIGKSELAYWSSATRDWVQDAAPFDVWVGGDSRADLHGTFRVEASVQRQP